MIGVEDRNSVLHLLEGWHGSNDALFQTGYDRTKPCDISGEVQGTAAQAQLDKSHPSAGGQEVGVEAKVRCHTWCVTFSDPLVLHEYLSFLPCPLPECVSCDAYFISIQKLCPYYFQILLSWGYLGAVLVLMVSADRWGGEKALVSKTSLCGKAGVPIYAMSSILLYT